MEDNTIYDSVFKTMLRKMPQLLVPFINECFGREYPLGTEIVQFTDEHQTPRGAVIDDSVFRLGDKIYHIECQSTPDTKMVLRMIEYDFSIALERAVSAGAPFQMDFPESCVLFLRDTPSTPDTLQMRVNLPDGGFFMYQTGVVKAQRFTSDEIFDKHLLLLMPYYLMRYERELEKIAGDDQRTAQLIAECAQMRGKFEILTLGAGDEVLYEGLTELIIKVSDHVLSSYDDLRKKVRLAMGGEVLELMGERAVRLEREAKQKGIKEGIERGIEQGIEQGIERMAAQLEGQGMSKDAIARIVEAAKQHGDTTPNE